MRINKKSNENAFLIGLLVLLAVIVIFLIFYVRIFDVYKNQENKNICAASVRASAALKIKGSNILLDIEKIFGDSTGSSDIQCPIIYKKIKGDEKYLGYKKELGDNVKQQIMQNMCECFNTFGEGKFELFDTKTGEEKYCVICHHMAFEGEAKNLELRNFLGYMADNDCIVRGKKVNAMSYLSGFTTDSELFKKEMVKNEILKQDSDTIDTSSEYVTMFLYTKQGFIQKIWASAAGASGGFLLSAAAGFAGVLLLIPEPTITKAAAMGILLAIPGSIGGGMAGYELGSERSAAWDSLTMVYPFNTESLKKLDCEYLPAIQQNQK